MRIGTARAKEPSWTVVEVGRTFVTPFVPPPFTGKLGSVSLTQPSVLLVPDSKLQLPQPPHAAGKASPAQLQVPAWHVRFAPHLFEHEPQLALSFCRSTQLPQLEKPDWQQMLPPVTGKLEQFALWQSTLVWHAPPLAVFATHAPVPLHIMFVPQPVPRGEFVPAHTPLALHVSFWVHSFRSVQDVLGEQLPTYAPLTHAMPEHALQVPLGPPPHVLTFCPATGTQVFPLQQPTPAHDVAVHTHSPALLHV